MTPPEPAAELDGLLERLGQLDGEPVHTHPDALEGVHRALVAGLEALDGAGSVHDGAGSVHERQGGSGHDGRGHDGTARGERGDG